MALDLVWPHVLDRWCAGLVSSATVLASFVWKRQWWDYMCSLTLIFRGWFSVNRPKRIVGCRRPVSHFGMGHLLRWVVHLALFIVFASW